MDDALCDGGTEMLGVKLHPIWYTGFAMDVLALSYEGAAKMFGATLHPIWYIGFTVYATFVLGHGGGAEMLGVKLHSVWDAIVGGGEKGKFGVDAASALLGKLAVDVALLLPCEDRAEVLEVSVYPVWGIVRGGARSGGCSTSPKDSSRPVGDCGKERFCTGP